MNQIIKKILFILIMGLIFPQAGMYELDGLVVGAGYTNIHDVDSGGGALEIHVSSLGASYVFPGNKLELNAVYNFENVVYTNRSFSYWDCWAKSGTIGGTYYIHGNPIGLMGSAYYTHGYYSGNRINTINELLSYYYHNTQYKHVFDVYSVSGGLFANAFSSSDLNIVVFAELSSSDIESTESIIGYTPDLQNQETTYTTNATHIGIGCQYMNFFLQPSINKDWETQEIYYTISCGVNISDYLVSLFKKNEN